jgi:hypothetical protein
VTKRQGLVAGISLAFLATLVASGENERREAPSAAPRIASVSAPPSHAEANEELDLEILHRPRRSEAIVDVFAEKTPPAAPPTPPPALSVVPEPSPPPPPPPPSVPPLPFRFVAKFVEQGATRLLLASGDKEHDVSGGEILEGIYRVDSVSPESVVFIYLPLNTAQTLHLAAEPAR